MPQLIAGNWKMHGETASLAEIETVAEIVGTSATGADILICPPATLISRASQMAAGRIAIGGQDCHPEACGAFTGDISAEMLRDAGASAVIVGHSERRQYHGETNALIAAKARAGWRAGLLVIICIGETEGERASGGHLDVCKDQLSGSVPDEATSENTAIAYEPVWAIGTGKTATTEDIASMHAHIRSCLVTRLGAAGKGIRILYGGSVKPGNAREILATPEVGGALVGGASLKAMDFHAIFSAAAATP
jgi:triosephosphate isomerase